MLRFALTSACLAAICMFAVPAAFAAEDATVAQLVDQLDTASGAALHRAVDELADHGTDAAPAVPVLSKLLSDNDDNLRWRAARTLAAIGPKAAPAVSALSGALGDESPMVRAYAAYALGQIGEASRPVAPEVVKAVTDKDALVRRAAIRALMRIKPDRSITIPLMGKLLKGANQAEIMPVLHSMAEMGKDGVPVLTEALDNEDARYWALLVLSEIGPDAKAAVPKVTELVSHGEPEMRMQAILALGEIGPAAKAAAPLIVEQMEKDEHNAIRYSAAYALGKIGAKEAAPQLQKLMEENSGEKGDQFLLITAAQALSSLFPDNEELSEKTAKIFIDGLSNKDRNVRLAAVRALALSKAPSQTVAPQMVAAIAKADDELIRDVIGMLSSMGAAAVPRVKNGLSNKELRHYAVIVLGNIGPDAKGAVPELVSVLDPADDAEFLREVCFVLARIGQPAAPAVPKLMALLNHDNERVRYAAAYALGSIGPGATKAAPELVRLYNGGDEFMRLAAIWALLKIRPGYDSVVKRAIPLLTKALSNEADHVRGEAAKALGDIGPPAESALPQLEELLKDDNEAVRDAAQAAMEKIKRKVSSP